MSSCLCSHKSVILSQFEQFQVKLNMSRYNEVALLVIYFVYSVIDEENHR